MIYHDPLNFFSKCKIFLFFLSLLDGTRWNEIYTRYQAISRTLCPISNRLYASSYNGNEFNDWSIRDSCHSTQSYLTSSKCTCYALYIPPTPRFEYLIARNAHAFKGDVAFRFFQRETGIAKTTRKIVTNSRKF